MSLIKEIIVVLFTVHVVLGLKLLRTYEFQMDHLEIINSPGGNSINFTTLRITKFNRTVYIAKGDIEILTDSASNIDIAVFVHFMHGNVYKQQPFKINRQPLCDFYKNEFKAMLWSGIKDFTNLPNPDMTCPLPKTKYWLKDYVFDESSANLPPHIPLGKHRYDLRFYEKGVESGGFMFYVNVVRPGQAY